MKKRIFIYVLFIVVAPFFFTKDAEAYLAELTFCSSGGEVCPIADGLLCHTPPKICQTFYVNLPDPISYPAPVCGSAPESCDVGHGYGIFKETDSTYYWNCYDTADVNGIECTSPKTNNCEVDTCVGDKCFNGSNWIDGVKTCNSVPVCAPTCLNPDPSSMCTTQSVGGYDDGCGGTCPVITGTKCCSFCSIIDSSEICKGDTGGGGSDGCGGTCPVVEGTKNCERIEYFKEVAP